MLKICHRLCIRTHSCTIRLRFECIETKRTTTSTKIIPGADKYHHNVQNDYSKDYFHIFVYGSCHRLTVSTFHLSCVSMYVSCNHRKKNLQTATPTTITLTPEQFLVKVLGHNQAQKLLKGIREQHNTSIKPSRFSIRLPFGAAKKAAQNHAKDVARLAQQYGWTPPDKQ